MLENLAVTFPTVTPTGTGAADDSYQYLTFVDGKTGLFTTTAVPDGLYNIAGYNWIATQLVVSDPVSGTTPTLAQVLQTSFDGTNWATIFTYDPLTTVGAIQTKAGSRHMLVANALPLQIGRFLRWKFSVGSASGSPVYTITGIIIMGN